jgi:hypothetical protein
MLVVCIYCRVGGEESGFVTHLLVQGEHFENNKIKNKGYNSYVKRWIRSTNAFIVNIEHSKTTMFGDETVHVARQEAIPPSALTVCVIHKPTDDIINKKHGREMHLH